MVPFRRLLFAFLVSLGIGSIATAQPASGFTSQRANFSISFQDVTSDLSVVTTAVMPGATLRITAAASASASDGDLQLAGSDWIWTAPMQPGRAELLFEKNDEQIKLHVFILTPFANGTQTSLNGFKVGAYNRNSYRGLKSYAEPQGFIDLSHGPADLKISPHFTLGQFICKQQPGHDPTYLLVRPGMLLKLETLLEAANDKGWTADTFFVMSGYRTPFYNAAIGNRTTSSRHLYGGAADIYIDHDRDGNMDDLNGDGRIDKNDARALAKLASSLAEKGGQNWPSGGIGIYGSNAAHGPFVHIDARGYVARWGQ